MYIISNTDEWPNGYVNLSDANHWVNWLNLNIPASLEAGMRHRLNSNLKHLMVGLEIKAALIVPHANRGLRGPVLFESYFQNLILEFCVAAASVLEGLGSAHWLSQNGLNGADNRRIYRNQWRPALASVYDPVGDFGLDNSVQRTLETRDRSHQDNVGARAEIDWHAFSYVEAFLPASQAISTLLRREAGAVPQSSNLTE